MKVEKQHTSVELENFFIYGSKMRLFWQVTILVCVLNGKFNKEGNKRPLNTFKRQVLVLILCSLAWRLMSLLLNSLHTAVLVFKLRSPQCLLTPIFTLMTSFFSFSLKLTRFGIFSFKKLCRLKLEFCFFICRK